MFAIVLAVREPNPLRRHRAASRDVLCTFHGRPDHRFGVREVSTYSNEVHAPLWPMCRGTCIVARHHDTLRACHSFLGLASDFITWNAMLAHKNGQRTFVSSCSHNFDIGALHISAGLEYCQRHV